MIDLLEVITLDELEGMLQRPDLSVEEYALIADAVRDATYDRSPVDWLSTMLPQYFPRPFASHHEEMLAWAWSITLGQRKHPFLAVWPRGGAKSTIGEAVQVMLGARLQRRYGLYIGRTQEQADDHVANVASMLESPNLARYYPDMARRALGMYGNSKGWRRNRLRTASGFTLDAIGLDTAARGVKMDEDRPGLITVDDIDDPFDTPATVKRMIDTLGRSLFQAGAEDLIVLMIQNLVHQDGVIAQTIDGRAELLADRKVSGPIPAILGEYAIEQTGDTRPFEEGGRPWRIVGGTPSWEGGQDITTCEAKIAEVGPTAWEAEAQHKPKQFLGGMYDDVLPDIAHCTRAELPDLVRKSICVDPAVTETDHSDSHGIQCDGIAVNGTIYRLRSWEHRASPGAALERAITWAYEEGCIEVGVEMNVGSDMSGRSIEESWRLAFAQALEVVLEVHPEWAELPPMRIKKLRATTSMGSKQARSSIMHADYERPGRIVHVIGDHEVLEAALARAFVVKPFDLTDAAFYSWRELRQRPAPSGTGLDVLAGSIAR